MTGSASSAREVVSLVADLLHPQSVLDVGCGVGTWLAAWKENDLDDYLGVDGTYIHTDQLLIPAEKFLAADLEKPLRLQRKFDLIMSLEVAEHIRPEHAETFIKSLCLHGDLILFSAAIPSQGGVNHVNEQYPAYWARLFSVNGFTGYDCIRSKIWLNKKIDTCYRQNLLFFVRDEAKKKYPHITSHEGPLLPLVHPEHFQKKEDILVSYKRVVRTPFHAAWHFIKKLFPFLQSRQ